MAILNLTPDSFWEASRAGSRDVLSRVEEFVHSGVSIVDIGAVSTRPGATDVSMDEEWSRLEPSLKLLSGMTGADVLHSDGTGSAFRFSIDTTRAEIIRRCYGYLGPTMIANDISAGEDDAQMLDTVAALGLTYIAMHKRGNPRSMDSLCDYSSYANERYPSGVIPALLGYFDDFGRKAATIGIRDWILDPGLGFAKTREQCWEIIENIPALKSLGRPVMIGAAHKRFTGGDSREAERRATELGADILRVHI